VCARSIRRGERYVIATVMIDGRRAPAMIHESCSKPSAPDPG